MTEPTTNTSVATREQIAAELRRTPLGQPSAAAQQMIAERKALNEVARQIGNLTWGKSLGENVCRAVAEYCRRYNIDPATEIDVLGGRIYRNANYFLRRGAELRRQGLIREVSVRHINADPRLTRIKGHEGAESELADREFLRIMHNVPDEAKGAVIVTIYPVDGAPVTGVNWAGSFGSRKDPVGDNDPGKTAETRAYRRAWRHLVETIPALKATEDDAKEDGKDLSEVVREEIKANAEPVPARLIEPVETVIEPEDFTGELPLGDAAPAPRNDVAEGR